MNADSDAQRLAQLGLDIERPGLTTQFYFPDKKRNRSDGLFRRELVMQMAETGDALVDLFDVVLALKVVAWAGISARRDPSPQPSGWVVSTPPLAARGRGYVVPLGDHRSNSQSASNPAFHVAEPLGWRRSHLRVTRTLFNARVLSTLHFHGSRASFPGK